MMLTFLGAAGEVTGSCLRVDHERGAFLVDCGLFQGGREADRKNRDALDFELRDVHGPNMLTEIHNIRPGVPVIVMTADSNPRTAQSALERGARACLSKPFALHELLNEVEDAVGIHNN